MPLSSRGFSCIEHGALWVLDAQKGEAARPFASPPVSFPLHFVVKASYRASPYSTVYPIDSIF